MACAARTFMIPTRGAAAPGSAASARGHDGKSVKALQRHQERSPLRLRRRRQVASASSQERRVAAAAAARVEAAAADDDGDANKEDRLAAKTAAAAGATSVDIAGARGGEAGKTVEDVFVAAALGGKKKGGSFDWANASTAEISAGNRCGGEKEVGRSG